MLKHYLKNRNIFHSNNLYLQNFSSNSRKFSSKTYNNFVRFSDDLDNNELKVPIYEKNHSIFLKKDLKISDFIKMVEGVDQRIQKIEFLNHKGESVTNSEQNLLDCARNSFILKLNGHINIKYFPSVNMIISNSNQIDSETNQKEKFLISNNFNFFLFKNFDHKDFSFSEKSFTEFRKKVDSDLINLLEVYENLLKQFEKSKERLDKKFDKTMKLYLNLGILFFLVHAVLFYFLIYHFYGWDTIEPTTYIVANVYWIIGLSFFIYKKKRLDFSFIYSETFKNNFYKKNGFLVGFNEVERNFVAKEINEIQTFREALNKF